MNSNLPDQIQSTNRRGHRRRKRNRHAHRRIPWPQPAPFVVSQLWLSGTAKSSIVRALSSVGLSPSSDPQAYAVGRQTTTEVPIIVASRNSSAERFTTQLWAGLSEGRTPKCPRRSPVFRLTIMGS